MKAPLPDAAFWRNQRVLLTGHTGFKGSWAALWLARLGAKVTGFALPPADTPALYETARIADICDSRLGDLRDFDRVGETVTAADPRIVLHFAAQPLVRRAIADPLETFSSNVMGTVHLLEALRASPNVERILVVTSDKVYDNRGHGQAFSEEDPLGGKDPYSASKAATEMVVRAYAATYFTARGVALVTARGGNVIGGGDMGADRIVPDVLRAHARGQKPVLRMPDATRPWQHVLDCVACYLLYAEHAHEKALPHALNFGPYPRSPVTVGELTRALLMAMGAAPEFIHEPVPGSVEMTTLAVDASAAERALGFRNRLDSGEAVRWTADWWARRTKGEDAASITRAQIEAYETCLLGTRR